MEIISCIRYHPDMIGGGGGGGGGQGVKERGDLSCPLTPKDTLAGETVTERRAYFSQTTTKMPDFFVCPKGTSQIVCIMKLGFSAGLYTCDIV